MALHVTVPVSTEVIESNPDCTLSGGYEEGVLMITIDTREQDIHQRLGLDAQTPLHWGAEHVLEVQELSALAWPIRYRVLSRDGYYVKDGQRVHFTTAAKGVDARRAASEVLMRAAVLLVVVAGVGYRRAAWLLMQLFHVEISKSALCRWVEEVAESLPSGDEIIGALNEKQPITEAHFDELFPRGSSRCVLVLKDEHGRIVALEAIEKRDEAHVKPFLARLKRLGLTIKTFYIDHCQAYMNAIKAEYPEAEIQYDYFHILQNLWRHVWKELCRYRKKVKARGEASGTPWYSKKLKALAEQLWKHRYLFFKSDKNLTPEEKEKMLAIISRDTKVSFIRGFLEKVWPIFEEAQDEAEARKKLEELRQYSAQQPKKSGFIKAIHFLDTHFHHMITFLRVPGVQRNSLAESGMRVLRRLERTHDGFRSDKARQNALKIYQAVMYLGWSIHDPPNLSKISVR